MGSTDLTPDLVIPAAFALDGSSTCSLNLTKVESSDDSMSTPDISS